MRVLLDTHSFLWWVGGSLRLTPRATDVISKPDTEVLVSVASAWEIAIKASIGRLDLEEPAEQYVPARLRRHGFAALPVELAHALRAGALPRHHGDPFDRLLIAQAQVEDLPIISADPLIGLYDVEVIW
jgi:PIN domain nuclease of toxin-antitoxin system